MAQPRWNPSELGWNPRHFASDEIKSARKQPVARQISSRKRFHPLLRIYPATADLVAVLHTAKSQFIQIRVQGHFHCGKDIPTYAWKASFSIFGRNMRTQSHNARVVERSSINHTKQKTKDTEWYPLFFWLGCRDSFLNFSKHLDWFICNVLKNSSVTVQKQRTVLFFHCVRIPLYTHRKTKIPPDWVGF